MFAQSDGLPHDVGALLKDALLIVEGRGGGRGNLSGGGVAVAKLDAALLRGRGGGSRAKGVG